MDFMNEAQQKIEEKRLSRRAMMSAAIGGGVLAAMGGLAVPAEAQNGGRLRLSRRDISVVNFALQLEYLEAEFYLFATTGQGLPAALTSGRGTMGATTGGSRVTFTDTDLEDVAQEITVDEVDHVELLRGVLGRNAVAKPAINLNALGLGFRNETEFLILSRAFEDTGVTAYTGAAPFIRNRTVLLTAARILATEAYHAGNIRFQVADRNIEVPALDGKDQPPNNPDPNQEPPQTGNDQNFFMTDENALSIPRSFEEVVAIVSPFFPNGLNR
ncbi:MAG TPA: ferritin-like domain-containing protein [Armatimonadota bacterium]|nr:ferritin-like domain-containing protein [Armatimonadota bacterium]